MTGRNPPAVQEPLDLSFSGPLLEQLVRHTAALGDAFRAYAPAIQREIYVFGHPAHAKHVLVTHHQNYTKGIGIERVAMLLGTGLMVSEGELWRRQRRTLQAGFPSRGVAGLAGLMAGITLQLRDRWRASARRTEPINLTLDVSEAALETILRAVLGDDLDRLIEQQGHNPFALLADFPDRNLGFAFRFRSLSPLLLDWIRRRREHKGSGGGDLLSQLLEADDVDPERSMSDQQLVDEVLTLVVAGHETSASALNWMWYLLSQHPEVVARLHREVDRVPRGPVSGFDILNVPYVRQIIEETLRLYPPGWLLTRRAIRADTVGGYELPAGSDVLVSPYLLHRHAEFWPDPERFDPDRFAPGTQQGRDRPGYLPFGLGPRSCIGEHFAMMEMLVHATLMAQEIRLELVPQSVVELEAGVNLRTRHRLTMMPVARQ